jgi:peptide chain release factor 1
MIIASSLMHLWSVFECSDSRLIYKVSGENVLENFRLESGIHKLQRNPPTEHNGRRHTSTLAVCVLPFITFDPQYKDSDFRIECYIGTGKGGQHKNKTMSAVRITHIRSGITACADGRCQHTNKTDAMAIVLSRLKSRDAAIQNNNTNTNRVSQIGNMSRGCEKIRTYNFIEDRVKDERVDKKFRTKDIMNGRLDLIYNLAK